MTPPRWLPRDQILVVYATDFPAAWPHGLSNYKGVLVVWGAAPNEQVFNLIDALDPYTLRLLVMVIYHLTGLTLRWTTHVPDGFSIGDELSTPLGNWLIQDSQVLGNP